MKPEERARSIGNIVDSMKAIPERIHRLQIKHFFKADEEYGRGVAAGPGMVVEKGAEVKCDRITLQG